MSEKGTISIHSENIFPIIKKFLYSDNEIFLRELVSNAVDASQKLIHLSSIGEFSGDLGEIKVKVSVDKENKKITISDNGIGMTAEDIKKYINQIAFSGATEFVEKYKDAEDAQQMIGHFGLGFYSAFMVAEKVEIVTLSYKEGSEAARWECDGSTSFEISKAEKKERGTDIILHVGDDTAEFLEEARIQGLLDKYAKFLPVEIQFGEKDESIPDGEDKDGKPKYKTVKKDNIINNPHPIWTKSPSDLKDEDYIAFYKELYPFSEDPLFWIHLNVDYPFNLTGVLYFPKIKQDVDPGKSKIQLYSRQVYITDEVKNVVPEFLMLLHGVIDSPDIPLNVSRSSLQADANVRKINAHITKKVADKLQDLMKSDRKSYEEKWESISVFVKYGMISEDKFYDKSDKFCLYESVDGSFSTLEEYKEKVKTLQTDKDENIVALYTNNADAQATYIDSAKRKGYDVLKLDTIIDSHFVNQLESKVEKFQLKRVDSDNVEKLIDKDEKLESVLSEKETTTVKELFEKTIDDKSVTVAIESLSSEDLPATISMPEFIRRMKDMQASGGGGAMAMMGGFPDQYNLSVNGNHPLVQKILAATKQENKESLVNQVYDLALLSQGMLKGDSLSKFVNRSIELVS
ncbi:MAG: molecular chaperone HtpG [Cyclobacteriaceae bacterium]